MTRKLILELRTNVTFRHPAEFIGDSEDGGGVLAVSGAHWFAAILRRVPDLQIEENVCQEDWGVVNYARHNQRRFWIGLSAWDFENTWIAHFHHGSFAWLQRFSSSGRSELARILADFHGILANEATVTHITWHEESEMSKSDPASFLTPIDD